MTIEQALGVAVAIALTLALIIRWLGARILDDWTAWRTRLDAKIDQMDPERMEHHYTKVHELTNKTFEMQMATARLTRDSEDHELRLRKVEGRGAGA